MLNGNGKRRVAIYIRVSTQEQSDDGYGLEAQKRRLLEFIEGAKVYNFDYKPQWLFVDVHTGSEMARPGLQALLGCIKRREIDAVLVYKIDRLSRNLKQLLEIFEVMQKHDVSFISRQENLDFSGPIGNLIFQIFGSIAQFERELIKGRTQGGIKASAELGNYTGNQVPYGYKKQRNPNGKGSKLVIIPDECRVVRNIYDWYIYEDLGDEKIAKRLNDNKVPRGEESRAKNKIGSWDDTAVKRILTGVEYRGVHYAVTKDESGRKLSEAEYTVTKIPACVSELTFEQAQMARENKKRGPAVDAYLLSGKIKDMTMESPRSFIGVSRTKGGHSYRRKACVQGNISYSSFEIPAKQIEDLVWGKIKEALSNPEVFIREYLANEYSDKTKVERIAEELDRLRGDRVDIENQIGKVQLAYESGIYSEETLKVKLTDMNAKIGEIDMAINELSKELSNIAAVKMEADKLVSASKQVKYKIDNLTQANKKMLCQLFVERVEVRRTINGKKSDVQIEVVLRFNPEELSDGNNSGRTQKPHNKKHNGRKSDIIKQVVGDKGKVTPIFRFRYRLEREAFVHERNGVRRGSYRAVVYEDNALV